MEEYLNGLGIELSGTLVNDRYIIDLKDIDTFGKIYSKLEDNEDLEESDESNVNGHSSKIVFESDKYSIALISDFDSDNYKLICSLIGDN